MGTIAFHYTVLNYLYSGTLVFCNSWSFLGLSKELSYEGSKFLVEYDSDFNGIWVWIFGLWIERISSWSVLAKMNGYDIIYNDNWYSLLYIT